MKNKPLPDMSQKQRECLTNYCRDQAEVESVTPGAIARRAAEDPELFKQATSYERPKPEPAAPEKAAPAPSLAAAILPAENRKPKTENQTS